MRDDLDLALSAWGFKVSLLGEEKRERRRWRVSGERKETQEGRRRREEMGRGRKCTDAAWGRGEKDEQRGD